MFCIQTLYPTLLATAFLLSIGMKAAQALIGVLQAGMSVLLP